MWKISSSAWWRCSGGEAPRGARFSSPHREHYLLLNHRLARRIVQAHADWLDEVESELGPRRRP
jgi:hypothetical protein